MMRLLTMVERISFVILSPVPFIRNNVFSRHSAKMNPLMRPYFFLLLTACTLVVLWAAMFLYSFRHLPKIKREEDPSKRQHLCQEFWKMILCLVGSEAVVLFVIQQRFTFRSSQEQGYLKRTYS